MCREADTIHVGWKAEPVRDDREKGHGTSVASRDGLAARRPRARDGPFTCLSSSALTSATKASLARWSCVILGRAHSDHEGILL
jgi:hypothetical protein